VARHPMGETKGHPVADSTNRDAGALLDELLASLLDDFEHWFQRGEELLQACPDAVMSVEERQQMEIRLQDGKKAIVATRALVAASTQPMAVSMEVMNPWHGLVTEVWALAAKLGSSRTPQAPS